MNPAELTPAQLAQGDADFVWHPFTPMRAYRREGAPIIVAGEGFYLIDAEGRRYLDGTSSLWCNIHGHRVPEIDASVRAQLDRVAHSTLLGLGNEPSIRLAHELVRRVPAGLGKVFYSDNGATAVEVALKLAFQYHRQKPQPERRDLFACVGGAYHGDTLGSVSVGGVDTFHAMFGPLLFPTRRVPSPVAFRTPPGVTPREHLEFCWAEVDRLVDEVGGRLAAFVIEPLVQGAAGILVHPRGYLAHVRRATQRCGALLIADEVAVGFGRTGTLFACEQEAVVPDLLCLAKGLTGGYLPLAATLATEEIADAFLGEPWEGRTFFHGHTYTGNPLGCAAALASLERFERRNLLANVRANSTRMAAHLARWTDHPHVGEVRQCGIMAGVELVQDRATRTPFPRERRIGHAVTLAARRRGVITRPLGDVLVLMPAPAMPGGLVDELCGALWESLEEVCGPAGR